MVTLNFALGMFYGTSCTEHLKRKCGYHNGIMRLADWHALTMVLIRVLQNPYKILIKEIWSGTQLHDLCLMHLITKARQLLVSAQYVSSTQFLRLFSAGMICLQACRLEGTTLIKSGGSD